MIARVASVDPSSTTTSSSTRQWRRSNTPSTVVASLYAGTTAMRRGALAVSPSRAAPSVTGAILSWCPAAGDPVVRPRDERRAGHDPAAPLHEHEAPRLLCQRPAPRRHL